MLKDMVCLQFFDFFDTTSQCKLCLSLKERSLVLTGLTLDAIKSEAV